VGGTCGTHGRGELKCTGFWWESPKERGHSEDRRVDGWDQNVILGRSAGGMWSVSSWLRTGAGGGLL
jgi:hypothetical protein